jgi:hypothetical protein
MEFDGLMGAFQWAVVTELRPQEYLDPGSGSLIIQTLVAGVLGAGFVIKMNWHRLKSMLTGRAEPSSELESASEGDRGQEDELQSEI